MLIQKFRKCSSDVKVQLFNSYCTSLYCAHLWSDYNVYTYNKLRVAYNNIFRGLMGIKKGHSISQAFVNNNVLSFGELIRKVISGFIKRIHVSENSLVISCTRSTFYIYGSCINAKWHSLLY